MPITRYVKHIEVVAFGEDIHPVTFFNLYQQTFTVGFGYENYHEVYKSMKESIRKLMEEHPEIYAFYIMYNARKNINVGGEPDSPDYKTPFWRNPIGRPQPETVLETITNHVMNMIRAAHVEYNPILQAGK